jgi:PAS domain S-box-containing protein
MKMDTEQRGITEQPSADPQIDWKEIFQAIGHPSLILDPDHRIFMVNRAALRMTGFAEDDLIGKYCYEIFHPGSEIPDSCPLKKIRESAELQAAETTIEVFSRSFQVACTRIAGHSGRLEKFLHVATDIKERDNAVSALKRSQQQYRNLFNESRDAVYFTSREGRVIDGNRAFFDLFGYTREEMLETLHVSELYAEPKKRAVFQKDIEATETVRDYPVKFLGKGGEKMDCLLTATVRKSDDGNVLGYQGIVRDITRQKKVEAALRESERKYSELVENSPDIIYMLDATGTFTFVGGAVSMIGAEKEDLIGKRFQSIVWPEDIESANWYLQERRTGSRAAKCVELRLKKINKSPGRAGVLTIPVELHAHGVYKLSPDLKRKNFMGTYGVIRDIVMRKQAEDALRQSAEELKKESRERRILSKHIIELLERDRKEIAMELHDYLGQILTTLKMDYEVAEGRFMAQGTWFQEWGSQGKEKVIDAIRSLKEISYRIRPETLDALGLSASMRSLINDIKNQAGIEVTFFEREIPIKFNAQKELALYRIVQEAFTNIIKHSQAQNVFVNLVRKGKVLNLSVEDDGIGFEPSAMSKLKGKGAPLGLIFMKERAIQAGGKFTIESQKGKGSLLIVEIPISF